MNYTLTRLYTNAACAFGNFLGIPDNFVLGLDQTELLIFNNIIDLDQVLAHMLYIIYMHTHIIFILIWAKEGRRDS